MAPVFQVLLVDAVISAVHSTGFEVDIKLHNNC